MLIILSAYPGVCGGKAGDPSGVFPNALRPGEANGLPYVDTVGDRGATLSWLSGVGPFGNSHCVAWVGI